MARHFAASRRRVTTLVLGNPAVDNAANWLEIAPGADGAMVVSERFARRRLPAPALASMRSKPCFYMCVDDVNAAIAQVPGRRVGAPALAHGMREVCVDTPGGMVVLAQPA